MQGAGRAAGLFPASDRQRGNAPVSTARMFKLLLLDSLLEFPEKIAKHFDHNNSNVLSLSGHGWELVLTCRSLATFDPFGIPACGVANPRHSWAMAVVRALQSGRQTALGDNANFCK